MREEGQFNLVEQEVKKLNKPGQVKAFTILGADSEKGLPYDNRVSQGADDLEDVCVWISRDRGLNWKFVLFAIVETLLARHDLEGEE